MDYISSKISVWREYYLYIFFVGMIIRAINLYSLLPQTFDSIFFRFIGIGGLVLLFLDFCTKIKHSKFHYNVLLILYMTVLILTSFINRKYGVGENLKTIMWSMLQYFLIYQFAFENPNKKIFFNRISFSFIYSWFILSLGSMVLFFSKFGYEKYYDARHRIRVGFLESRLFGLYSDVNNAAIAAFVVIILAIYFLNKKQIYGLNKFVLVSSIPLQFIYIVLSGSRTTFLICLIGLFIAVFIIAINKKSISNVFYRFIFAFSTSLLSLGILIIIYNGVKWGFQMILPHIKEISFNYKKEPSAKTTVENVLPNNTLIRKDVANNTDISNARLTIWKSAIELFKTKPIIGISPKNLVPYAQTVLPNGYIAKAQIAIHNAYLSVLTFTGILGFIPFSLFLSKSFILNVKNLVSKDFRLSDYRFFYYLVLLSYALYAFFNNELVYENTIGTFIFWLFLGRVNNTRGTEKFILFK